MHTAGTGNPNNFVQTKKPATKKQATKKKQAEMQACNDTHAPATESLHPHQDLTTPRFTGGSWLVATSSVTADKSIMHSAWRAASTHAHGHTLQPPESTPHHDRTGHHLLSLSGLHDPGMATGDVYRMVITRFSPSIGFLATQQRFCLVSQQSTHREA